MKKVLAIFMAVLMLLTVAPLSGFVGLELPKLTASAATYGDLTYVDCGTHIEITDCDPDAKNVIIPTEINGKPVTSIGSYDVFYEDSGAFSWCESLESIIIPDSVTSIGDNAFSWCESLESITIPDSVTSIGDSAFYNCDSLESITIPDSVTSIGNDAFFYCSSIEEVYISSITAWLNINFVNLASNPLCQNAKLYLNNELIEDIIIPNSVTEIKDYAFSDCESLQSITILEPLTRIGDHAFSGCSSLESVTILGSVTSIGDSAFSGCNSLESVTILGSATSIGDDAFSGCNSLISITLPDSVTSIGWGAFSGTLYYRIKPNWENGVLYIGNHLIDTESNISGNYEVKNGTKTIADWAFSGCSSLQSITIPDSVTSIGVSAFSGCSSLQSITIPDSVTSIGWGAFAGCSSLQSITIPNSVTIIGDNAFIFCDSLQSITIPNSVTSIGDHAFYGCSSLANVNYAGTKEQWTKIRIGEFNSELIYSTINFSTNSNLGDINGDGKVTATDARLILRIATKLEKLEDQKVTVFAAADVNGDGKITATDARKVLRVSTKLENF